MMRLLLLTGLASLIAAQLEFCDSTIPDQKCSNGMACDTNVLDCSRGVRQCSCSSMKAANGEEFCDSTIGNQRCSDGTECRADVLDCSDPTRCQCGTRVQFCDSTADPPQKCADGTPCSAQWLDCDSKGPRRCACPIKAKAGLIQAAQQWASTNTPKPAPAQPKEEDNAWWWQEKPSGGVKEMPRSKALYAPAPQQQPQYTQQQQQPQYTQQQPQQPQQQPQYNQQQQQYGQQYNQQPQQQQPQQPQYNNQQYSNNLQQPKPQQQQQRMQSLKQQVASRQFGKSASDPIQPGERWWKREGVYFCDSTGDNPQTCNDGTPCNSMYLDCETKGPRRCICPNPYQNKKQPTMPLDMNGLGSPFQQPTLPSLMNGQMGGQMGGQMQPQQQQIGGQFDLGSWLNTMQLGEFENIFRSQQLTSETAIRQLTDSQLKELGMLQMGIRNRVLDSIKNLDNRKYGSGFNPEAGDFNVRTWLGSLNLAHLEPQFHAASLNTPPKVAQLTDRNLKNLGIDAIGARNRILSAAKTLGESQGPFSSQQPNLERMPLLQQPMQQSTGGIRQQQIPEEWSEVANRLARFFPTIPKDTLHSSLIASKGDGQKAAKLIRQSTGLLPQEYVEVVEEIDVISNKGPTTVTQSGGIQQQQQQQQQPMIMDVRGNVGSRPNGESFQIPPLPNTDRGFQMPGKSGVQGTFYSRP